MLQKKSHILCVLKILQEYSDSEHPLSRQNILDYINSKYNIDEIKNLKTISNDIEELREIGFNIAYVNNHGYYYDDHTLSSGELSYLVDAVFSSKSINGEDAKNLINKLKGIASKYDRKQYDYIYKSTSINRTKIDIFDNIDIIRQAIDQNKQIMFDYIRFNVNGKTELRYDKNFHYHVSPYFLINNFGKYYLLCNDENPKMNGKTAIANYRIDYMTNLQIIDTISTNQEKTLGQSFNIDKYINDHIYMFSAEIINAKIEVLNKDAFTYVYDWFGNNVYFYKEKGKNIAVIKSDKQAFYYWCMQYLDDIKILEPKNLRNDIYMAVRRAYDLYDKDVKEDPNPLQYNMFEIISNFIYTLKQMPLKDLMEYKKTDLLNRLYDYLKYNSSPYYEFTPDGKESMIIKNMTKDDDNYYFRVSYASKDCNDQVLFNLLKLINNVEKYPANKKCFIFFTPNSSFNHDSDCKATIFKKYFAQKTNLEVPAHTPITYNEETIVFEKSFIIKWPVINVSEDKKTWYRYFTITF